MSYVVPSLRTRRRQRSALLLFMLIVFPLSLTVGLRTFFALL